jgi:SsrA-binding protein
MVKTIAQNRRARFDYEILETIEAGLMLTGPEVKSCRAGHANLAGSYVSFHGGKAVLKNAKISRYAFSGPNSPHAEMRDRPLLLKKNESEKLERAISEKGIAIVALEIRAGKYIKVLLGLARGRKKLDKRARIKEREQGRRLREGREI